MNFVGPWRKVLDSAAGTAHRHNMRFSLAISQAGPTSRSARMRGSTSPLGSTPGCGISKSLILATLFCAIACTLHATPFLSVSSPTTNIVLSADDFAALQHAKIKLRDPHEKKVHRFSGVPVSEILARVGTPFQKLHGRALRQIVIFRARDAYAVSFSLADFDADFSNRTILLADQEDGAPLSDTAGPLRLIVSGDKEGARWVRMVNRIEIIDPDRKP